MTKLSVADVRAKFPQYEDLSDEQLLEGVRRKFYADIPREKFFSNFGMTAAPSPSADRAPPAAPRAPVVDTTAPAAPQMPATPEAEIAGLMTPPAPEAAPRLAPVPPMPTPSAPSMIMPDTATGPTRLAEVPPPSRPYTAPIEAAPAPDTRFTPRATLAPADDPLIAAMTAPQPAPAATSSRDLTGSRAPSDPFEGEGFGALAARRGQQFAQGATDVVAAVPEALAITGERADRSRAAGAAGALDQRAQIIADIEATLADPNLDPEDRAILERNLADLTEGQGVLQGMEAAPITPAQDRPIYGQGEKIRTAVEGVVGAPDPRDRSFWGQVATGAGNMTGMIGAAAAGTVVGGPIAGAAIGAGTGSAMNQAQVFEEALQSGADQETALQASRWAALIGASEIIPITRALKLLPPRLRGELTTGMMRKFVDIAQASGEEAAQEYLATVANNIVAQQLYDPERGWTEGATDAALVGAVLGAGVGTAGVMIEGRGDAAPPATVPPRPPAQPQTPEEELAAALGAPVPQAAPAIPSAPAQPAQPQAEAAPAAPQAPPEAEIAAAMGADPAPAPQQADPTEGGRFEILDEIENTPGGPVATGRKVRVDLETGQATVVGADGTPAQAGGAPGADSGTGQQPQAEDAPVMGAGDVPPAAARTPDEELAAAMGAEDEAQPRTYGVGTFERQADDSDEVVTVNVKREGPFDFNDTFPAPDPQLIDALEVEGRSPFDGDPTPEEVAGTLIETMGDAEAEHATARAWQAEIDTIQRGGKPTFKVPQGKDPLQHATAERDRAAQAFDDLTASVQDVWGTTGAEAFRAEVQARVDREMRVTRPQPGARPPAGATPAAAPEDDIAAAMGAQPAPAAPVDGFDVGARASRFPTTLEDIATPPQKGERGRQTHIYGELDGQRFYLGSVVGNAQAAAEEWAKTYPQARILTTDRADGTSINGEVPELDALIAAKGGAGAAPAAPEAEIAAAMGAAPQPAETSSEQTPKFTFNKDRGGYIANTTINGKAVELLIFHTKKSSTDRGTPGWYPFVNGSGRSDSSRPFPTREEAEAYAWAEAQKRYGAQSSAPRPQPPRRDDPMPAIDSIDINPVRRDSARTPAGTEIEVEYAIVELDDLIASNLPDGRVNPDYPQERQPRDRTKDASERQIQRIMRDFDPRQLLESPTTDTGAMIVDRSGYVESGNGRTLALQRIHAERPDLVDSYRAALKANGYPIDGMDKPVLVRIRRTEMTPAEIEAYTRESNTDTKLAMSATEQAMADANALPDSALDLYRGGDIDTAANRDFVRAFIQAVVTENEQGKMIAPDGSMSQDAVRRVQAALLAKAYGDSALVAKLIESADNNIKSIGGALLDVSASWAKMRAAARAGTIAPEMDQTEALIEAVRLVDRARSEKRNVIEFVKQPDLLSGDGISPMGQRFLALMFRDTRQWTKPAGRDNLARWLGYYVEEAMKSAPGADLFGAQANPGGTLDLAKEKQDADEKGSGGQQADLFAPRPAGSDGAGVRPADGGGDGPRPQGTTAQDGGQRPAGQPEGVAPEGVTVRTISAATFAQWKRAASSPGTVRGWRIFDDRPVRGIWVLMTEDKMAGPFADEAAARAWAQENPAASTELTPEPAKAEPVPDGRSWWNGLSRDQKAAVSKAAGLENLSAMSWKDGLTDDEKRKVWQHRDAAILIPKGADVADLKRNLAEAEKMLADVLEPVGQDPASRPVRSADGYMVERGKIALNTTGATIVGGLRTRITTLKGMIDKMEGEAKSTPTLDELQRALDARKPFIVPGDGLIPPGHYDYLTDSTSSLWPALAKAKGEQARRDAATQWVRDMAKNEANVEYMVMFDTDGAVIAALRGTKDAIAFPPHVNRALQAGKVGFTVHNHPSNRGASLQDMKSLINGAPNMRIVGTLQRGPMSKPEGDHLLNRGPALTDSLTAGDIAEIHREAANWLKGASERALEVLGNRLADVIKSSDDPAAAAAQANAEIDVKHQALGFAFDHILTLALARAGILDYTGNADAIVRAAGVNPDDFIPDIIAALNPVAGRLGLQLARPGDQGRDRAPGSDAGSDAGGAGISGAAARAPRDGDGRGRADQKGEDLEARAQAVSEWFKANGFEREAEVILSDARRGYGFAIDAAENAIEVLKAARAAGGYPEPNQNLVYSRDDVKPGDHLELRAAKRGNMAEIDLLEVAPGQWVRSTHYEISDAGGGGPLMVGRYGAFPSRDAALADAVASLRRQMDSATKNASNTGAQMTMARKILAWLDTIAPGGPSTPSDSPPKTRAPKSGKPSSGNADLDAALDDIFGDDDVSGPGDDLERDSGDAEAQDDVGGTDVPPAAGGSQPGAGKRGGKGGGTGGKRGGRRSIPGGDAAPVGGGGDPGLDAGGGTKRRPAAGGNGGRRAGSGKGGLSPDAGGGANPAGTAAGGARVTLTDAERAAAIRDILKENLERMIDRPGFAEGDGLDPRKYEALEALFIDGMRAAGADPAKMSDRDMFRAIATPLKNAGLDRETIVKMAPYLEAFTRNVKSGRVKLDPEPDPQPAPEDKAEIQRKADRIKPVMADEANIRATLPLLLPEQQDDVVKIETRFAKPDGHGMLITNGTGTGKTFTGGGQIKRFVQMGKSDILIVAPSEAVIVGWKRALEALGVPVSQLRDTRDAGQGVVITTYANLEQNEALATRSFDLVVADESQNLMSNKDGNATGALNHLRAITHRPADLWRKHVMIHADEYARLKKMRDGEAKTQEFARLRKIQEREVEAWSKQPRSKVLFLSATPFAYDKTVDYVEGYLFDYPKDGHVGHSRQDGRALFMIQNFGYRIRYHKLTKPESAVDSAVFEREFHEKLKREGVLSGRSLQIDVDYDRKFVTVADAIGTKIDAVLKSLSDGASSKDKALADGYRTIRDQVMKKFNYLKRMQLLEAIKAKAAVEDIKAHLALGRKVVVFHDYNVGGGFNPFGGIAVLDDANAIAALADLLQQHPDLNDLDFSSYGAPADTLKAAFGKQAAVFSGLVPQKQRLEGLARFNTDDSGTDILIVQSDAGGAGISMHDLTGTHQRVLINLGMPTKPTTTLQEEGRILRVGTVTDAIFRYYTIGTAWERAAFAQRIAERSGTVENLALGNEARMLRDAFIDAYVEAEPRTPSAEDGKGGKAKDGAAVKASPYEIAKTHYFGKMKVRGRRDQREGDDWYATPEPLGFKMVQWAGARPNERVLEPSAGDGAIARYFPENVAITMVEPSNDLGTRAQLRAPTATLQTSTFEDYHIVNKHHVIVMNPPFGSGGATAVAHVAKAARHLRDGGRIVALIPGGPAADKRWNEWWLSPEAEEFTATADIMLPAVAFERAGTNVMTHIVVLDKIANKKERVEFETMRRGAESDTPFARINLTGAKDINDFFDRLEGIGVPRRPDPKRDVIEELEAETQTADAAAPSVKPGPALTTGLGGFKLGKTKHSKTGDDLFVATIANRVERDVYTALAAIAKQHGGWYSNFRGNGAIPGFQFKSEAARAAFLEDAAKPTVSSAPDGFAEGPGNMISANPGMFFSPLLRAVETAKQNSAQAKDWKAIIAKLPGVKKAEMEWVGINEWLDAQGDSTQVTRAQVAEFVRANQISIIETVLTEDGEARYRVEIGDPLEPDDWSEEAERYLDDARDQLEREEFDAWDGEGEFEPTISDRDVQRLAEEMARENYATRTYSATLYDLNGNGPDYEGIYDEDDYEYQFPDLGNGEWTRDPVSIANERNSYEAQFIDYTESGGTNYREILLRVPNLHNMGKNKGAKPFVQSSHFTQENIIVHARVKDRTDAQGNRVLFIEEIQSDLASYWRENDEDPAITERRDALKQELNTLKGDADAMEYRAANQIRGAYEERRKQQGQISQAMMVSTVMVAMRRLSQGIPPSDMEDGYRVAISLMREFDADLFDRMMANANRRYDIEREILALGTTKGNRPGTPRTPWQDPATYELMAKRLVREAAMQGYQKIAWTPGWMQAARWNEAGQSVVEGVQWRPTGDGLKSVDLDMAGYNSMSMLVDGDGMVASSAEAVNGKPLAQLVGPSLAQQILTEPSGAVDGKKIVFSDSGYAIAYDGHVRRAIEKLGKAYGVRPTQDGGMADFIDDDRAIRMIAPLGAEEIKRRIASITSNRMLSGNELIENLSQYVQTRMRTGETEAEAWATEAGVTLSRENFQKAFSDVLAGASEPVWSMQINDEMRATASAPVAMFQRKRNQMVREAEASTAEILRLMPRLRAELDRLDLKRVKLYFDPLEPDWQGMFQVTGDGDFEVIIGAALDPMKTLHHEVIHIMRQMNLFTPEEWRTLELAAGRGWMERHDIEARYPNLTHEERLEEAIAEEFSWALEKMRPPKGNILVHAFNKIHRLLKAIRNVFQGAGFNTPEDIFGRILSGEISKRQAWNTGYYARMGYNLQAKAPRDTATGDLFAQPEEPKRTGMTADQRREMEARQQQSKMRKVGGNSGDAGPLFDDQTDLFGQRRMFQARPLSVRPLTPQGRAHRNTAMGGPLFIPDRRVWDELTRAGVPIWQRIRNGAAAASDAVDRARQVIQDRFLPVLRAQEAIMRATGRPIPADQNAYIAETTFSGKVGRHLLDIDEVYTKPIIQLIAETDGELTVEGVGEWLYARHALERNAYIASINPTMPDGGSGMTDQDAQDILSIAAAGPHAARLKEIGRLIDGLRERTLKLREDAGLISNSEAALWRSQYKYYVPLKGFAETDHAEAVLDVTGIGKRYSIRGQESRRALGRSSEAFNPLQAAITQAQEASIRAEKNRVGQALYELAKGFPSKALWEVKTPAQKRYFNRSTGLVETRVEDPVSLIMDPNEMAVKVNGKEVRIILHDERLARAANTVGADQMSGIMRLMSMFSRFFSMTRTMLNPEFMVTNAFRDFQTAQFNIQAFGEADKNRIAAAMAKNWRKAFLGVMRGQKYRFDTEWSRYFDEFQKSGAQVWFWTMEQPEVARDEIERRVKLQRGGRARRALAFMTTPAAIFSMRDNPVLAFIEKTNLAVDNAIRLAAFVEARKAGWSVEQAAFLAKELTVNFNRRGEVGAQMNALYPFFNAAIQGTVRTAKALTSKRVAKMVGVAFVAGVLNDLVNAALSEEDEDEELVYDKIPDYRNERNIHIGWFANSRNPVAIPMPYGYNVFPYAGQQLGKVIRGVKDPSEAFGDVLAAAFGAFSPINAATPLQMVSPVIADPIAEMAENKNWLGAPIYPQTYGNQSEPDAYVHFRGATEVSKMVAQALNGLTGGDFRQSGSIDVSPETLDHLASFVVGSAGAFWGRTTDFLAKTAQGNFEEIEGRNVPFVRNIFSPVGEWVDRDRFYQFRAEVRDARADAKAYATAGQPVPADVAKLAGLYDKLLEVERELNGKGDWNPARANALTPREDVKIYLDFNREYLRVAGKQGQ